MLNIYTTKQFSNWFCVCQRVAMTGIVINSAVLSPSDSGFGTVNTSPINRRMSSSTCPWHQDGPSSQKDIASSTWDNRILGRKKKQERVPFERSRPPHPALIGCRMFPAWEPQPLFAAPDYHYVNSESTNTHRFDDSSSHLDRFVPRRDYSVSATERLQTTRQSRCPTRCERPPRYTVSTNSHILSQPQHTYGVNSNREGRGEVLDNGTLDGGWYNERLWICINCILI